MTTRMVEVARAFNAHVHKIEKVDDLRLDWLREKEKVGIIGANETPAGSSMKQSSASKAWRPDYAKSNLYAGRTVV